MTGNALGDAVKLYDRLRDSVFKGICMHVVGLAAFFPRMLRQLSSCGLSLETVNLGADVRVFMGDVKEWMAGVNCRVELLAGKLASSPRDNDGLLRRELDETAAMLARVRRIWNSREPSVKGLRMRLVKRGMFVMNEKLQLVSGKLGDVTDLTNSFNERWMTKEQYRNQVDSFWRFLSAHQVPRSGEDLDSWEKVVDWWCGCGGWNRSPSPDPSIRQLARLYLSVPASNTTVERAFAAIRYWEDTRRSRLTLEHFEEEALAGEPVFWCSEDP